MNDMNMHYGELGSDCILVTFDLWPWVLFWYIFMHKKIARNWQTTGQFFLQ